MAGSVYVGVFSESSQAEQAMEDLRTAGFRDGHLHLSTRQGGVSGQGPATDMATNEAFSAGLPTDAAQRLQQEVQGGRTVLVVKPEALGPAEKPGFNDIGKVFHKNGAQSIQDFPAS